MSAAQKLRISHETSGHCHSHGHAVAIARGQTYTVMDGHDPTQCTTTHEDA
jgi:hypothetical protein